MYNNVVPDTTQFGRVAAWADNSKGPASLRVENYAHGEDASLDSWVLLVRKENDAGSSS